MARIASKILWWESVDDAASYQVRIVANDAVVANSEEMYAVAGDNIVAAEGTEQEVDLALLTQVPIAEGTYDIFITALDEAGNESDALEIADAVLDFFPPVAPASGGFR